MSEQTEHADPWGTPRGLLRESADYLRVDVHPSDTRSEDGWRGWDVCLYLDGTYSTYEGAHAAAGVIREHLAAILAAEIPGLEERLHPPAQPDAVSF